MFKLPFKALYLKCRINDASEKMAENKDELKHSDEEELVVEEAAEVPAADKAEAKGGKKDKKDKLLAEVEKAQAAAEDYKRKWYAVSAEYDNYRKRTQTQASQAYADGKAEAILKLLPVADTFGYALDGASDEKTKAGIEKVIKNFNTIISSLGVEEIPVQAGDEFDESVMEAIMNLPCEEGEKPNAVKQILKKGYRQGGKVIRFAQVTVTI